MFTSHLWCELLALLPNCTFLLLCKNIATCMFKWGEKRLWEQSEILSKLLLSELNNSIHIYEKVVWLTCY